MAYGSPVFAAQEVLQQLLTQQAQAKRQATLDVLNNDNVRSEIAARDENAKSQKAERESMMADRVENEKAKRMPFYAPGQDLGYGGTPSLLPQGTTAPAQFPSAQMGITPPAEGAPLQGPPVGDVHPAKFLGDGKQQQSDADDQATMEFLKSPGAAAIPVVDRQTMIARILSHDKFGFPPAAKPAPVPFSRTPQGTYVDSAGKLFSGTFPDGAVFGNLTRPPQGPQNPIVQGGFHKDADGNMVPDFYEVDRVKHTATAITTPPKPTPAAPPPPLTGSVAAANASGPAAPIADVGPQALTGRPVPTPGTSTSSSKYIQPGDESNLQKYDLGISGATDPKAAASILEARNGLVDKIVGQWKQPAGSEYDAKADLEFLRAHQDKYSFDQMIGMMDPQPSKAEKQVLADLYRILKNPGSK